METFQQSLELNRTPGTLAGVGRVLEAKGQYNEAVEWFRRSLELNRVPGVLGHLGYAYAEAGNIDMAQQTLAELQSFSASRQLPEVDAAAIKIGLGRTEEALELLEKACARRAPQVLWIRVDPRFVTLRREPRFIALSRRMGLER